MTAKRAYGTGSLMQKHGAWYGRWRLPDGRRLSRRIGPVREPGTDAGLTRREAEAQLRKIMLVEEVSPTPKAAARHTVNDAATALIEHKRVLEFPRFRGHLIAGPSGPAARIDVHAVNAAVFA